MTTQTAAFMAAHHPSPIRWRRIVRGVIILVLAAALLLGQSTTSQHGQITIEGHSGKQKVSMTFQPSSTGGCQFRIDLWIKADAQSEWRKLLTGRPSESTTPCGLDFLRTMIESATDGFEGTGWWIAKQLLFGELIVHFATQ